MKEATKRVLRICRPLDSAIEIYQLKNGECIWFSDTLTRSEWIFTKDIHSLRVCRIKPKWFEIFKPILSTSRSKVYLLSGDIRIVNHIAICFDPNNRRK